MAAPVSAHISCGPLVMWGEIPGEIGNTLNARCPAPGLMNQYNLVRNKFRIERREHCPCILSLKVSCNDHFAHRPESEPQGHEKHGMGSRRLSHAFRKGFFDPQSQVIIAWLSRDVGEPEKAIH